MRFYHLTLGSGLNLDQGSLIQALSQLGGSTIQTSDGLFTGVDLDQSGLSSVLQKSQGAELAASILIKEVLPDSPDEKLTPDMKNLMEKLA